MEKKFFKKKTFYDKKLINLIFLIKLNITKKCILFNKFNNINSLLINKKLFIHKGNIFKKILVSKYHIDLKLKNFLINKKPFNYPIKKKSKNFLKR